MSNATLFAASRARIVDLVKNSDPETPVPTCPGWSVKDLVAHLAVSLGAYVDRDMEGATSPSWGDNQVAAHRETSLQDCLAEWEQNAARAGDLFESPLGAIAMADVLAHEQDIRTAIGQPGERKGAGVGASVEIALGFIEKKIAGTNLPPFRIVTDDVDRVVGEGPPAVTLSTSTYELWRSMHGRRSRAQVRAMEWDGDPTPYLDVFFVFGPAEDDIEE